MFVTEITAGFGVIIKKKKSEKALETQPYVKKNRSITAISGIVILFLIITVILQYSYISELKRQLFKTALSEGDQSILSAEDKLTRFKIADQSSKTSGITDSINDKEKIKKLESRIADMQTWQDYLEESLQKYQIKEDEKRESLYRSSRIKVSKYIDAFVEEHNLPSDIKIKLFDLLFEKQMELIDLVTEDPPSENPRDFEQIRDKYDEQIYELMPDMYSEYEEFNKVQNERAYVNKFKRAMLTGNDQLEKSEENKLIEAFYNDNQIIEKIKSEKTRLLYDNDRKPSSNETTLLILEMDKMEFDRHIASAKNILSETKFKKFQEYLDPWLSAKGVAINQVKAQMNNAGISETDQ